MKIIQRIVQKILNIELFSKDKAINNAIGIHKALTLQLQMSTLLDYQSNQTTIYGFNVWALRVLYLPYNL